MSWQTSETFPMSRENRSHTQHLILNPNQERENPKRQMPYDVRTSSLMLHYRMNERISEGMNERVNEQTNKRTNERSPKSSPNNRTTSYRSSLNSRFVKNSAILQDGIERTSCAAPRRSRSETAETYPAGCRFISLTRKHNQLEP